MTGAAGARGTRAGLGGSGSLRQLRDLLLPQSERPFVIAGRRLTPQAAQACNVRRELAAAGWATRSVSRTPSTTTIRCMPAMWASASTPSWQRVSGTAICSSRSARLGEMTTGGYSVPDAPRPRQKLVHIHGSAEELNRVYQADLAIFATMNAAARGLEVLSAPPELPWSAWTADAHADYAPTWCRSPAGAIDMPAIVATLQRHLPA